MIADENIFGKASAVRSILTRDIFSVQVYLDEIGFELQDKLGLSVDMEDNYIRIHNVNESDKGAILAQIRNSIVGFLKRNQKLICNSLIVEIADHIQAYADACTYPEWIYDTIISPNTILVRF
ncbi:MAG: hypothetical protein J6Y02_10775 [Pseudobutyrivibrio sp.]|nr:hypothetical protein [Pseudobutyrivibrio sp.]